MIIMSKFVNFLVGFASIIVIFNFLPTVYYVPLIMVAIFLYLLSGLHYIGLPNISLFEADTKPKKKSEYSSDEESEEEGEEESAGSSIEVEDDDEEDEREDDTSE
ncbi:hypothetical protein HgNV_052 [Homarus gammarus nudivirus]|uniref:Uncharacterized protein n=1 Tax=Homarus gammarus nudivirus TaxID=2509616 RepID=A0A411HB96_9VIRU|nr:hypothetical protein KM727_gp52 [Homarus gammarus nudivirus]QBB28657.1 hypothetical protein HgNV_052 [Homarus gammarus nudivirus]